MNGDDRTAALRANQATYQNLDEKAYVRGAPHLRHASVARIYETLVDAAISGIGRDASTIRVLELGAGSGLGSTAWFSRGVQLTAVDSSAEMLSLLTSRASAYGAKPATIVADALEFVRTADIQFDIVTHVSMLHHVPDYLSLLASSAARVQPGGALISFQDPLRYDRMPAAHHVADRASYFAWRLAQGNYRRGLRTRWRRLRGVYSEDEVVDFDEYHVVRNGVDSAEIVRLLQGLFAAVEEVPYWSTYSGALQAIGQRLRLRSSFGILASGHNPG
jgi:2-polyprenyl-3-methyl-5-hydroxy-6-metoxy-1,4-benzoquinol methylase